ncbi:MAG: class I SAM-dependent methyltransferase [Geobacteraceae bacterium]|nr:class I SAM-dependent methyltransferase [Geobacteraceae bacterium]
MKEDKVLKCRICGNSINNEIHIAREMIFGLRDEFEYFQCSSCGCLQIREIPADLGKYYPPGYYSFEMPKPYKIGFLRDLMKRRRTASLLGRRNFLGWLMGVIYGAPDLPGWLLGIGLQLEHRILDVGSGSGKLLVQLRNEGFHELYGVDPFIKSDIIQANGVCISKGELSDVDGQFDFVMLNHSLEHMPDPHKAFQLLGQKLSDNGLLLIRIPVVSSFAWEKYKTSWFKLDAPRHFYLHSFKSICLLARSHGFQIVDLRYDSTGKQFWASEQYLKGIHYLADNSYRNNPHDSMFNQSQIYRFEEMAQELNAKRKGDQACFYLRKCS